MIGENWVSLLHTDRTSGLECIRPLCHDRLYIWSQYHTSALRVFMENLIFSPLSAYSPTPKANTDYNLHAKQH